MKASGNKSTLLLVLSLLAMIAGSALKFAFDPSQSSGKRSSDDFSKMAEWYLESDLTRQVPEGTPDSGSGGALISPWIAVRIPENATDPEKWRVIDWNFGEVSRDALSQVKMVIFCRERTERPERVVKDTFYSTTVRDSRKIVDLLYCDARSGELLDVGITSFTKQVEGYFQGSNYMVKVGSGIYTISDDTVRLAIREKAPANRDGTGFYRSFGVLYVCGFAGLITAIVWKIVAWRRRKKA